MSFFQKPLHRLALLSLGVDVEFLEDPRQTLDVFLRLFQMIGERLREPCVGRGFGHRRQTLEQPMLGVVEVPQFVDVEILKRGEFHAFPSAKSRGKSVGGPDAGGPRVKFCNLFAAMIGSPKRSNRVLRSGSDRGPLRCLSITPSLNRDLLSEDFLTPDHPGEINQDRDSDDSTGDHQVAGVTPQHHRIFPVSENWHGTSLSQELITDFS
jgi:hypothetical protein